MVGFFLTLQIHHDVMANCISKPQHTLEFYKVYITIVLILDHASTCILNVSYLL